MNNSIEKRIELKAPILPRALTDYLEFGEWFRAFSRNLL